MPSKFIIVGGVAGGATFAARLRRLDPDAEILVYEKSPYVSYANCGLPYYLSGTIEKDADLLVSSPEALKHRYRIDARVSHEVISVDAENKKIEVKDLASGNTFIDHYDVLVLSPGTDALVPANLRIDSKRVFTLKKVEDALKLRATLKEKGKILVAGGGFIGLETAENLALAGHSVTVCEMADQLLAHLDREFAAYAEASMEANGVRLLLGSPIESMEDTGDGILVKIKGHEAENYDAVVLSLGVRPATRFLVGSDVKLDERGYVEVDERFATSAKDVYAIGDAIKVRRMPKGNIAPVALAGPANKEARLLADIVKGKGRPYYGAYSTSIVKVFEVAVASTGLSEKQARAEGYDVDAAIAVGNSHASYYPDASTLLLKLVYDRNTYEILGAEAAGRDGADKRIDVLATAMKAGMKAYELLELDLAYAPPFSSAKDPVNVLGMIVENKKEGLLEEYRVEEIPELEKEGAFFLDVRTPLETRYAPFPVKAKNIPVDELGDRLNELPKDKTIYVSCEGGLRSYVAYRILVGAGYKAKSLAGGHFLIRLLGRNKKTQ